MNELVFSLSPEERELAQAQLWQLLAWQTAMFTGGDSSSVPTKTAQELLSGLCYTLQKAGATPDTLLTPKLKPLLEKGRERIRTEVAAANRLWQKLCILNSGTESLSMKDTLKGIGLFFQKYDLRYFPHRRICDIDYQLCIPTPESLLGVDYISEYLRRLMSETRILSCFDRAAVASLLDAYSRDWRGLLVNLCEPVLTNALGLVLIGAAPLRLRVSSSDRQAILSVFETLPRAEAENRLADAALSLCKLLSLSDEFTIGYAVGHSKSLYPRIELALHSGGLDGIFIDF